MKLKFNPQMRNAVLSIVHDENESIEGRMRSALIESLKPSTAFNMLASNLCLDYLAVCFDTPLS